MFDQGYWHRMKRLIDAGKSVDEISAIMGVKKESVYTARSRLKRHKTVEDVLAYERNRQAISRLARGQKPRDVYNAYLREINGDRNREVIRAVDSGATYSDAARMFGITRNVVAGIVNRRPEGRA